LLQKREKKLKVALLNCIPLGLCPKKQNRRKLVDEVKSPKMDGLNFYIIFIMKLCKPSTNSYRYMMGYQVSILVLLSFHLIFLSIILKAFIKT